MLKLLVLLENSQNTWCRQIANNVEDSLRVTARDQASKAWEYSLRINRILVPQFRRPLLNTISTQLREDWGLE